MALVPPEAEALSGPVELVPGCEPLVLSYLDAEGALVDLYYRIAVTPSGDFLLVDATGQNRCLRLLPGLFTNQAYNVRNRNFPPFTLSRNELSGPGSYVNEPKFKAPFVRVSARNGKLVLSQEGIQVRKEEASGLVDEIQHVSAGTEALLDWEEEDTEH